MQIVLDQAVQERVLLDLEYSLSAVRAVLLPLQPVRETAAAVGVQAWHKRDCLVHDKVAYTTVELFTHLIHFLL